MKILVTTDLYTTATNGVVTSTKNLIDELQKRGHDVRVLTLSEDRHAHKEGSVGFIGSLSLEFIYPNIRMPKKCKSAWLRELIEWKPDVIHSQCEFFTYPYALKISQKTGAPIVHTFHTMYEDYVTYVIPFKKLGAAMVRRWVKDRLRKARYVIAPTEKVKSTLSSYGLKPEICVLPSGIDLEKHKCMISNEARMQKRMEYGILPEHFVLLNLGRLGTEKNLDELINFFAKAYQKNNNLRLLIVGDGPARAELENHAHASGLDGLVIFTGMVAPGEVSSYYQLGDLFVSASTSETQGLTYIEASANGLPLLCRQDPCLQEVINNGKNGYAYTTEEEFHSYLDMIQADSAWCKAAKEESLLVAKKFDKVHFGEQAEHLYLSAIGSDKQ